ncbi:MAG: type II secretion system F family protein [Actinobacteria bacterium]|nr:type II secretion system F family protein [Actinomycetota bacterium]
MTAALLVGLGVAAGILLTASGLAPAALPLDRALARLHHRPEPLVIAERAPGSIRAAAALLRRSPAAARVVEPFTADLRVAGVSPAEHLAQRLVLGILGLVWAPVATALFWAGGVRLGFALPLWLSVVLAPLGFFLPSLMLRSRAAERRRAFRHALSAFLDVVAVSLASGRGVDTALHDAARAGQGWPFVEMKRALLEAQLTGETPWAGLGRLGGELAIPELNELAASAALAGAEGARVRSSVAAKARALRLRGLTEVEAAAHAASERMSLPVVVLMLGFIVFLGYPAMAEVIGGI